MKKSPIRVLVIGGSGFIGTHYLIHARTILDIAVTAPMHDQLDILDSKKLQQVFHKVKPQVVINFAAHRDANTAEKQRGDKIGSAWKTNVEGVNNIARACNNHNSYLIHISTDMVFSGSSLNKGPYGENQKPENTSSRISWYGWTKAQGEKILKGKKNTAIIRIGNVTASLYDPKLDYVGKLVYLYDRKKLYPLFYDQHLTLTYVPHLFQIIDTLTFRRKSGVYHVASSNAFTPHQLGEYIIRKIRCNTCRLPKESIETYLQSSPNRYPRFGGLNAKKTARLLSIPSASWEEIVDTFSNSTK